MSSPFAAATSIECPRNPGVVCPYRAMLDREYGHSVVDSVHDSVNIAELKSADGRKLTGLLIEHAGNAMAGGCEAPTTERPECEIADRMSQARSRQAAKSIFKTVGGLFKRN